MDAVRVYLVQVMNIFIFFIQTGDSTNLEDKNMVDDENPSQTEVILSFYWPCLSLKLSKSSLKQQYVAKKTGDENKEDDA